MNNTLKNILLILIVILSGLFLWYFIRIVIYIVVSAVLSLLGQPIVDAIRTIPFGKKRIPTGISAFITLLLIISVAGSFVSFFFPLLASQVTFFSRLDVLTITQSLELPLTHAELFLREWNLILSEESIGQKFVSELMAIATFERFSSLFGSVINFTIELFIGFLSISFITFFFLKEKKLFSGMVLFFTPIQLHKQSRVLITLHFYPSDINHQNYDFQLSCLHPGRYQINKMPESNKNNQLYCDPYFIPVFFATQASSRMGKSFFVEH